MRTGTVLVVDDEQAVRAALQRVLAEHGYTVASAANAEEALELLHKLPVQVIISDQHMGGGGLSGVDLLKVVRVRHPRVVRILLTGGTSALPRTIPRAWRRSSSAWRKTRSTTSSRAHE
jgi:DNA-binding NtrC family response regulator